MGENYFNPVADLPAKPTHQEEELAALRLEKEHERDLVQKMEMAEEIQDRVMQQANRAYWEEGEDEWNYRFGETYGNFCEDWEKDEDTYEDHPY